VNALATDLSHIAQDLEKSPEDNVQTVLCKAYKSIYRFERRSRISTWLVSLTINEALMRIRNRRPEPLALDLLKSEGADSMPIEISDSQHTARVGPRKGNHHFFGEVTHFQAA
jgi:DNA-directed RNA polymerase specialized sigma24 family protein